MEVVSEVKSLPMPDYITVSWLLLIPILALVIGIFYNTLHIGMSKSEKKLKRDRQMYLKEQKDRKRILNFLKGCSDFADKVGGGLSPKTKYAWDFRILRTFKEIELIGRTMTSEEFVGLIRLIQFVSVAVGISGVLLSGSGFFIVMVLFGFVLPTCASGIADMQIKMQNEAIDRDFAEVYLLVHTKLLKGAGTHIAPTLTEYLKVADATKSPEEQKYLRSFVKDLLTTINVVTDERAALHSIREKYSTATIVNFCNLAEQALNGTDVAEKLLTFKLELLNRTKQAAEVDAKRRAEKAQKAIYVVWVILGEVVTVAMVTRFIMVM